jgi:MSHA biogenesis protein MshL
VRKFYGLYILLTAIVLSGCVVGARKGTSIDNMHAGLKKDLITDQEIAQRPHQNAAMNTALLQSQTLHLAAAPGMDRRFDISVNNAPAKSFFMGLVSGTPYNMVVSPDITGAVSLKLKNVTVEEALQAVEDIYGYNYQRTSYGFEVLPPSLQTQMFTVNYLDVQRNGRSNVSLSSTEISETIGSTASGGASSSGGSSPSSSAPEGAGLVKSGAQVITLSKTDFWGNLQKTLTQIVGATGGRSVTVDPQSGIAIVRAYPNELREVARYLDKTQLSLNRQVILEAKVLEVQLNDAYQAGINWSALRIGQGGGLLSSGLNAGRSAVAGAFANPETGAANAPAYLPGQMGADGGFLTANIGGKDFGAIIQLLEQQGNVQVLSSPRISTVNNQQAVIKVGGDNFFVTSVTTNVVPSGGSNTTSSSVGLTPFFSGITLDVTPEIGTNGDIVLHVHPSVSTVTDQVKTVNLGSGGGVLTLPLAESTVRESDNIVHARNGQVVVIGGLMQRQTSENLNSAPGLSRIPFLGALFRNTAQASLKSELVILIRPVIVNDNNLPDQIQDTRNRFCQVDRGFHVGSRPEIFGTRGEVDD